MTRAQEDGAPATAQSSESAGESVVVSISVESLVEADSPRVNGTDRDHVRVLAESPFPLPPILVHRATFRIIDGMHRFLATKSNGVTTIRAHLVDGDADEAFVRAVRANIDHGLPLTLADRTSAATRLIRVHPEWSDRRIAAVVGLSPKTAGVVRGRLSEEIPQTAKRVGRDGRARRKAVRHAGDAGSARAVPTAPTESTAPTSPGPEPGAGRAAIEAAESPRRSPSLAAALAAASADAVEAEQAEPPLSVGVVRPAAFTADAPADGPADAVARNASAVAGRTLPLPRPPSPIPSARTAAPDDRIAVYRMLRRDPSFRLTETGRFLLRLLDLHVVQVDEWERLGANVPAHQADSVADLARECARAWLDLADRITTGDPMTAADR